MEISRRLLVFVLVGIVLVGIVVIIWIFTPVKNLNLNTIGNSCDRDFLQWCRDNPGVGDYDNFANEQLDCEFEGSYRTCAQVTEALT